VLTIPGIKSLFTKVWVTIYTYDPIVLPGLFQYFVQVMLGVVVWDHLITLSDEVKYVWKGEISWNQSCRTST